MPLSTCEKQSENPTSTHRQVRIAAPAKHCMSTETEFLARNRHTLDDGTLCAPYPPVFFMRDIDKDEKEMSSYTPSVCFSEKQQIFI